MLKVQNIPLDDMTPAAWKSARLYVLDIIKFFWKKYQTVLSLELAGVVPSRRPVLHLWCRCKWCTFGRWRCKRCTVGSMTSVCDLLLFLSNIITPLEKQHSTVLYLFLISSWLCNVHVMQLQSLTLVNCTFMYLDGTRHPHKRYTQKIKRCTFDGITSAMRKRTVCYFYF